MVARIKLWLKETGMSLEDIGLDGGTPLSMLDDEVLSSIIEDIEEQEAGVAYEEQLKREAQQ